MLRKHRLDEMSWKEAEEAFGRSDTVIMAVGTLHSHGPTPIGIDTSSVARIADEVGERTGLVTLPAVPYGENDKMALYPGSITISPNVLEAFYTDICRSLHRNGVRKVIVLNGHGGNREPLVRTGRNVRGMGMLIAVLEWWNIGNRITPEAFPEGTHIWELAVALAVGGTEIADVRAGGYKGEWGVHPPLRRLFGEAITPVGFSNFEYRQAPVIIPIDCWDVDVESEPEIRKDSLETLKRRGEQSIERIVEYVVAFAKEFEKIDPAKALRPA